MRNNRLIDQLHAASADRSNALLQRQLTTKHSYSIPKYNCIHL